MIKNFKKSAQKINILHGPAISNINKLKHNISKIQTKKTLKIRYMDPKKAIKMLKHSKVYLKIQVSMI